MGILLDWTSSTPGTTFFSGIAAKLGLAYYSISTFVNLSLSCMICYRLVCHARIIKEYLGYKHASPYMAIVALVIESVLPFTLSSIAFLVSYGMGSQAAAVFSFIHPQIMVRGRTLTSLDFQTVLTCMQCISPQMLILRVANGEAWQKDETRFPESIIRVPPGHEDTFDGIGAVPRLPVETLSSLHLQSGREDNQV